MKSHTVEAGILELAASLQRVKTHLSWLDLDRSERRQGDPVVTAASEKLLADLRNEVSHFHALVSDALDALTAEHALAKLPESVGHYWRSRVLQLDHELNRLNIPKTF